MREIKFRVWDTDKKAWVKHLALCVDDITGAKKQWHIFSQFTGLLDRNGKEIYEGDIITGWTSAKEVVEYDNDNARFEPLWLQLWNNEYRDVKMEVIGNIYENPELINE